MDSTQVQIDSCQTRRELAEKLAIAARLYAEAVVELIRERTTPSRQAYCQLRANLEEAQQRSEVAGCAFGEHVEAHGCGCKPLVHPIQTEEVTKSITTGHWSNQVLLLILGTCDVEV
jgi:hypothetical protein